MPGLITECWSSEMYAKHNFCLIIETHKANEKTCSTQNVCFIFLYNFSSKHPVMIEIRVETHVGLHVRWSFQL
jgi:hypothetical protein